MALTLLFLWVQCLECLGGNGAEGFIVGPLSWSPDGKWIAYSGQGGRVLFKANYSGNDTMVLKGEDNGGLLLYPTWCRDSTSIVYAWVTQDACEIRKLHTLGGTEISIFKSHGEIRELRLSPDGGWVSFVLREDEKSSLYMLAIDGEGGPLLVADSVSGREYSHSWDPESKALAVIRQETDSNGYRQYLELVTIPDKKTSRLDACGRRILSVEWSPKSDLIAYCARSDVGVNRVWTVGSGGTLPRALSTGSIDLQPDWSPDGELLAYVKTIYVDGGKGENRIFIISRTGVGEAELEKVGLGSVLFSPKWSPDGRRIACIVATSSTDGNFETKLVVVEPCRSPK